MLWRPRSILQLVLIGLVTVIAPLCAAIFFTVQTLDSLSRESSQVAQSIVALTRNSQALQSDLFDLERRARQYVTLDDPDLLTLFKREHQQLLLDLEQIAEILDQHRGGHDPRLQSALYELTQLLKRLPISEGVLSRALPLFDEISRARDEFQRLGQLYVDAQLESQAAYAEEVRRSLIFMVASLATFTLAASFFFVYWINRPVKQLETEIRQLGSGDLTRSIKISGPLELQVLGRQLEWLRSRLHELEQQKQQFLRHMSHELKTPLASLCEGADLMAEGVVGDMHSKQREIVEIIQQNSQELLRLIENLLDYNRAEHGFQLQLEPVDIDSLWQELVDAYRISITRKRLHLSIRGHVGLCLTDATKIRTALDNLLSNAVNYTPNNGEIEISCAINRDILNIEMANSGQAIAEDERNKIFNPFFQGSNRRNGPIKGSGIGLSVARECIDAHGGQLLLIDHPRLPVCFRITCPCAQEAAA